MKAAILESELESIFGTASIQPPKHYDDYGYICLKLKQEAFTHNVRLAGENPEDGVHIHYYLDHDRKGADAERLRLNYLNSILLDKLEPLLFALRLGGF